MNLEGTTLSAANRFLDHHRFLIMPTIKPFSVLCVVFAIGAMRSHGGPPPPVGKSPVTGKDSAKIPVERRGGWEWRVGAGPSYRSLGGVGFRSGHYSAASMVAPVQPLHAGYQQTGQETSNAGPATSFADRRYRNGFVFIDDSTATPGSFLPGTTAYWGYEDNSQVRSGDLEYDAGVYRDSRGSEDSAAYPRTWESDLAGGAVALHAEAIYELPNGLRVGGSLGYLLMTQNISRSGSTFSGSLKLNERLFSVSDLYDLQGVVPPVAPYAGTFSHPGTAPLIDNIPSERRYTRTADASQTVDFANRIQQSFDLTLHTISLGPVVEYQRGSLSASVSLGLALNVAAWDAGFRESLQRTQGGRTTRQRSWQRSSSGTDLLPGFFLQGNMAWQLSERWSVSAFGRWDWCGDLEGEVGPAEFSADLGGATVGGSVTITF
jgi:hypothetical protein